MVMSPRLTEALRVSKARINMNVRFMIGVRSGSPGPSLSPAFRRSDGFDLAASGASLDGSSEGRKGQRLVPKKEIAGKLDFDYQELNRRLIEIKKNFRREQNVIIVGDQDVVYEDIVRTMDACRETADGRELFPAVAFSPGIVGG